MELMSPVLLCALVVFLPQALGQSRRKSSSYDNEFNDSLLIKRKMGSIGKNIILNKNAPMHSKINDLQSVFMDPACTGCHTCMERAMKAHKSRTHMMDPRISLENFQDDRNMIDERRDKRKAEWAASNVKKSKRSKPKNNKGITLMKYNHNGKIYALKINETNSVLDVHNNSETIMTCQVYSVKKSVSCESPEANLILTGSRKKTTKKGKKGYGKRETKSVEPMKLIEAVKRAESTKTVIIAPVYRKRNVDDSQVPEQIMYSIEEMY
ncbi:uncharacterized protein LOC123874442 [Maniola jurtina]|uniref:uncharacterized protein LOC123874442 n=1 Tax=Maniola jurtina TaxID=191418 RepID=UPI001E689D53|nr:uncharacterized protein LOC123874442 [Maniola jurtina]XP_045775727.1 uncharacterized protein LOC123874442 [Maniola jurtina]XP_045775728.1 uncharacterized protein LOC123874442 [Maniola jurtina]XP_045775729.1 uncharacterized protein LOC123874442 [Maniola jurtina]XP_045775730.1 uncharacterized protein LOC123874442 [Maniola jurtina]XP_045775731.1 uncharacterized protein LOC123874442 [Maniola jurtina]XP_045775733.1 uncharacterized protein LOC123874442 [Maniola jurtina]XP_045775734.1 uncharacte